MKLNNNFINFTAKSLPIPFIRVRILRHLYFLSLLYFLKAVKDAIPIIPIIIKS